MAATFPMIAVMGNFGIELLLSTAKSINPHKAIARGIIAAFIIPPLLIIGLKNLSHYKLSGEDKTITEACAWLKPVIGKNERIFWYNTLVPYLLNRNLFDKNTSMSAFYGQSTDQLSAGDIVLWDAHFGPNECHTPKEQLLLDSSLQLLAVFKPETYMQTLGGFRYEVCIFEKLAPGNYSRNAEAAFRWPEIMVSKYHHQLLSETPSSSIHDTTQTGYPTISINSAVEYAGIFVHKYPFDSSSERKKNASLMLIVDYTIEEYHPEMEFLLSTSFHQKQKNYKHYFQKMEFPANHEKLPLRSWMKIELPKAKSSSDIVKCFIHNTGEHGKINLLKFRIFLLHEQTGK
jgi:hypothetical protein